MTKDHRDRLDQMLSMSIRELDLPKTQLDQANERYKAVGRYLAKPGSSLADFDPIVFAQGSMALGTAIKPIGRDEFDLDFVCQLAISSETDPVAVKRALGERLKKHSIYGRMLEEKNRCWRLNYSGDFHMDIIPGIPDYQATKSTALLVPDKEMHDWKKSDPMGYATWFEHRAVVTTGRRQKVQAEVQPLPRAQRRREKLPLQVVVQLLKRHRDMMFPNDEDAPISIIITTLAAHAYDHSASIVVALSRVIEDMPKYIEGTNTGKAVVRNPVNHLENFADKWVTHPRRERIFYHWHEQVREDLDYLQSTNRSSRQFALAKWVGDRTSAKGIDAYERENRKQRILRQRLNYR